MIVAHLSDLWDGELVPCRVDDDLVFIVKLGDVVHAFRDRCPHLGVRLSEGALDGAVLTCRAHHHTFDVRTGLGVNPCGVALERFEVHVIGDEIDVVPRPATRAAARPS